MNIVSRTSSLHPLVVCIALALAASDAGAVPLQTSVVVQNCFDSGPGSLRQAVIDDTSGEPIDLTQLSCSTITLSSGAIVASQSLTLTGPGSISLVIDGVHGGAVFVEATAGTTLSIAGMTIRNGYVVNGYGGCIFSAGSVVLDDVVVSDCKVAAHGLSPAQKFSGGAVEAKGDFTATHSRIVDNLLYVSTANAYGGGISAGGNITLIDTTVSGNYLNMTAGFGGGHALVVRGGGFWSPGVARLTRSTISGNTLRGADLTFGVGGGFWSGRDSHIDYSTVSDNRTLGPYAYSGGGESGGLFASYSTISGNSSDGRIGAVATHGVGGIYRGVYLIDSTVSGNSAQRFGGVYANGVTTRNSTIAFNTSAAAGECAGVCFYSFALIESSIIANNTSGGVSDHNIGPAFGASHGVDGSKNLIGPSVGMILPPDTIQSDPLLAPLADNGGPTLTHALLRESPAIDGGDPLFADWDQRGEGYPRTIGHAADIGAFETSFQNQTPTAADDDYTTNENVTLSVSAPGVLANDSDPEDDALSIVLVEDVANGALTLNADGSMIYVPATDFFGTDSFTYEVTDGSTTSGPATVTIEVLEVVDTDEIFVGGFD